MAGVRGEAWFHRSASAPALTIGAMREPTAESLRRTISGPLGRYFRVLRVRQEQGPRALRHGLTWFRLTKEQGIEGDRSIVRKSGRASRTVAGFGLQRSGGFGRNVGVARVEAEAGMYL